MGTFVYSILKCFIFVITCNMSRKFQQIYVQKIHVVKERAPNKILWGKIIFFCSCVVSVIILYYFSIYSTHFFLKDFLIGFFCGIAVFFINYSFSNLKSVLKSEETISNNSISSFSALDSLYSSLLVKICLIILLASLEEYIFRSFILSFLNVHFSLVTSIILSAIIFYVIHINSKAFELIFMGAVFAVLTLHTDNMLPAIIAHSSNNLFVYFMRKK